MILRIIIVIVILCYFLLNLPTFSSLYRVVSSEGPIFTSGHYLASIDEDARLGSPVLRVEAASSSGAPLMYTIVAGNTNEEFALEYTSGEEYAVFQVD